MLFPRNHITAAFSSVEPGERTPLMGTDNTAPYVTTHAGKNDKTTDPRDPNGQIHQAMQKLIKEHGRDADLRLICGW
jgi:hypothetical protein